MNIRRYKLSELQKEKLEPLTQDSFFASNGFMNLWRNAGGRPVVWAAQSGDRIRAVLPGIEFGRGPLKRFQSMPDGCYGRIYFSSDNPADNQAVAKLLMCEVSQAGYVKSYVYDFYHTLPNNSGFVHTDCETSIVDVRSSDWMPPDKKMQSEIRKAEREGVTVTAFDPTNDLDRFMVLMEAAERRHGRQPKYSRAFFKALAELAGTDHRVIWWWCEHDGKPVTSHINFLEKNMALNWQVYYDRSYSYLKANQYLLYSLAQRIPSEGLLRLNLGASPPDAGSLAEYKEKWGGQPYHYRCHWRKSRLGKLL